MNQVEILKNTQEFMEGLLEGRSNKGWCAMACMPLFAHFIMNGFPCKLLPVMVRYNDFESEHVVLQTMDTITIIDPTASQFNQYCPKMPKVYVGTMPGWYFTSSDLNKFEKELYKTGMAFVEVFVTLEQLEQRSVK